MDYYTAQLTIAQDDHKVYWDNWKQQAMGQVFTTFNSIQSTIAYVMQLFLSLLQCVIGDLKSEIGPALCDKKFCSEYQTPFTRTEGLGTRLYVNHSQQRFLNMTSSMCNSYVVLCSLNLLLF